MSPRARSQVAVLAVVVALYLLVPSWLQYPLDLFVTFVHESGHALAALATGGSVSALVVDPNMAGYTMATASIPVYFGGYLGATAFGALLLRLNTIPGVRRYILEGTALAVALLTFRFGATPFTWVVGMGAAVTLAVIGLQTSDEVEYVTVSFLGVYVGMGALKDLDVLWRIQNGASRVVAGGMGHAHSDAELLARVTPLSANAWTILWILLSLWLLGRELHRSATLE
jgi:hypothetical protein